MHQRLKYLFLYSVVWIVFFQLIRQIFIYYQGLESTMMPLALCMDSAIHGLKMDLSFTGYLVILPCLLLIGTATRNRWYHQFMYGYTVCTTLLVVLLSLIDLELYRSWGFKIDATALHYLKTPKEALASVPTLVILLFIAGWIIISTILIRLLKAIINTHIPLFKPVQWILNTIIFLFLTAACIIPIRGGLQLAPMNQSSVYFSTNALANHAAVNASWNFFHSVAKLNKHQTNPYITMEEPIANAMVDSLYIRSATVYDSSILHVTNPNVLLIIWESFTAKAVKELYGKEGITPSFSSLIPEGLFFTNLYASGDRSDKGMISLLSGYPAQPATSIIKFPEKSRKLPSLPHFFLSNGFQTSYYYGGESEFANMKSYFLQQGYQNIIDKNAFDNKDMNAKWGAHDHIVFDKLLSDLDTVSTPFFNTVFTLSSHEPFDVPTKTVITGDDEESKFLNSLHYTDTSLGTFINQAKKKRWWANTLIIIVADHGHRLPVIGNAKRNNFHIPMLWLGGALKRKGVIAQLGSQTDIANTILHLYKGPESSFKWGNNLLRPISRPFAYFAFNDGFGFIQPNSYYVQDNVSKDLIEQENTTDFDLTLGRAYLQTLYSDFMSK